jgi:hypothetical protein
VPSVAGLPTEFWAWADDSQGGGSCSTIALVLPALRRGPPSQTITPPAAFCQGTAVQDAGDRRLPHILAGSLRSCPVPSMGLSLRISRDVLLRENMPFLGGLTCRESCPSRAEGTYQLKNSAPLALPCPLTPGPGVPGWDGPVAGEDAGDRAGQAHRRLRPGGGPTARTDPRLLQPQLHAVFAACRVVWQQLPFIRALETKCLIEALGALIAVENVQPDSVNS